MGRKLLFLLVLVLSTLGFAANPPASRDVDILAPDGFKLLGTYYPAAKPGPGVLLLHMCNTDRKSWTPLATQLAAAGINVLTVDNRGFGVRGAGSNPTQEQEAAARKQWPSDFDAAFAYLLAQPGVDKSRIGIGGGSCGMNNAIQTARRHSHDVKSLVLLAGGTDADGVQFLQQNRWIPMFTAAAADDEYIGDAPAIMQWFAEFTGNPRNKFMGFKDGRHGTEIFPVHPELVHAIVDWEVENLERSPADPNQPVKVKETPAEKFWEALQSPDGVTKAIALYRREKQRDPNALVFPEAVLNVVAYGHLQAGDSKGGLDLFKLNAEAYPDSANVYDSLADGYLAAGQNDKALEAEKMCVAKLPADKNSEEFKAMLRKAAEEKIKKLEPAAKKD